MRSLLERSFPSQEVPSPTYGEGPSLTLKGPRTHVHAADQALVEALLAEEPGSWDLFVERYAGLVASVVRRIFRTRGKGGSQADIDDVTENVFVMLLERDSRLLKRYDSAHKLSAYVAVIARTASHRYLRTMRDKVDLPDEMWGDSIADSGQNTASAETAGLEMRNALHETMAELSERDQRVLRLFYFDGRDYQSIARTLGLSVNSVGAALTRARGKLGTALRARKDLSDVDWRV